MGLGGEVDDEVDVLFAHDRFDGPGVAQVSMDKPEVRAGLDGGEAGAVAGIGQRVEHHDPVAGVPRQPVLGEVGAKETGAAGDQHTPQGRQPSRTSCSR